VLPRGSGCDGGDATLEMQVGGCNQVRRPAHGLSRLRESMRRTLGLARAAHIGADLEAGAVLAPIAKCRQKAKEVPVRMLRITAWAVALTTCAIFAGLVLGWGPELTDDAHCADPHAYAALAPAIVGLLIAIRQPRNVIAWILLVGSV